jgi:hypothetical protein
MEKQKLVGGLPKFGTEEVMSEVCETCQLGKQVRHPFLAQTTHVSSKPLEMIHSGVWIMKTKSIGGCKYYVSFIDDHTRKVWVYFMKHKGEVFQHFLNFKAMVEKEKGVSIKCLRSDGGGEYFSNEFNEYLKEHGIQRKYSCSYSPHQNGVAERKNRHIVEIASAITLIIGGFWGKPMWSTFWVWDARLTFVLILFFIYPSALHFQEFSANITSIFIWIGLINILIIKFFINWWNTLHQSSSISQFGTSIHISIPIPILLISTSFFFLTGISSILETC